MSRPTNPGFSDRRRHGRICVPFLTTVQGIDVDGTNIDVDTVLDNLGIGGLYFRMMRRVRVGEEMRVVFRLSHATDEVEGARVAVHGTVLRTEDREGGACGIAVKITTARFLWSKTDDSLGRGGHRDPTLS